MGAFSKLTLDQPSIAKRYSFQLKARNTAIPFGDAQTN
jgi:hypothetical protein